MTGQELIPMDDKEKAGWAQASIDVVGTPPPPVKLDPEIVQDFEKTRDNLSDISQTVMQAIAEAAVFASQAQNDKVYAALASLIRAANETQRDVMDLHKRKKDLLPQEHSVAQQHIHNNLIMTSSEVLKIIRGER